MGLWKQRDPIARLAKALEIQSLLSTDELMAIEQEIETLTLSTLEEARKAPYPDTNQLLDCVYYQR